MKQKDKQWVKSFTKACIDVNCVSKEEMVAKYDRIHTLLDIDVERFNALLSRLGLEVTKHSDDKYTCREKPPQYCKNCSHSGKAEYGGCDEWKPKQEAGKQADLAKHIVKHYIGFLTTDDYFGSRRIAEKCISRTIAESIYSFHRVLDK